MENARNAENLHLLTASVYAKKQLTARSAKMLVERNKMDNDIDLSKPDAVPEWARREASFAASGGAASGVETIKLLCIIEGADSTRGEITLRSPASISGIKIGDFATVELKRYK